jgi:hypothetical protein
MIAWDRRPRLAVFDRFLWILTYPVPRCDVSLLIYRNFAAMAGRVGVRRIRLEDPTEVEAGIAAALAHDGAGAGRRRREPDWACHPACGHCGDGEGFLVLHGEGLNEWAW